MTYQLNTQDRARLVYHARGSSLIGTADEQTLANLCLHFAELPFVERFKLRSAVLHFLDACMSKSGGDKDLLRIASEVIPAENPLSLEVPYRVAV